jgi:RNA polymerase sigma factor (sigma-70 family)
MQLLGDITARSARATPRFAVDDVCVHAPDMLVGRSATTQTGVFSLDYGCAGRGIADVVKSPRATTGRAKAARFETVVLPHLDAIYNLARFLTRSQGSAEDIVQEALLRAFRAIDTFRGADARPWVLTIVRNSFHTWARITRSQPAVVPLDMTSGTQGESSLADQRLADTLTSSDQLWNVGEDTPETALIRRRERAAVRSAVASVPEPFREVLVLRELEELSYRDIARITGTPVGTVMSRLARAREMFATAWKRQSGEKTGATEAISVSDDR